MAVEEAFGLAKHPLGPRAGPVNRGSAGRGEHPAGPVRGVAHLDPGGSEAVPDQVGDGVVAGLPGAATQLEERFHVGADEVPRVPDADPGDVAQPEHEAAQDPPGVVDVVVLVEGSSSAGLRAAFPEVERLAVESGILQAPVTDIYETAFSITSEDMRGAP